MVVLAGLVAYWLRFAPVAEVRPVLYEFSLTEFVPLLAIVALGWVCIFALSGLYAIRGTKRFLSEITGVFLACSSSVMALIVFLFFQREFFSSRFIIVSGWLLAVVFVSIGRWCIRRLQRLMLQGGLGSYGIVIIGNNATASALTKLFSANPVLGYRVVQTFPEVNDETVAKLKEWATTFQNGSYLRGSRFLDGVVQADPRLSVSSAERLKDVCSVHHLSFRYVADLFQSTNANMAIETIGGVPVIEVKGTRLDGWGRIWKRFFDVAVSVSLLVVLSPIFLLTACAVKLDSRGPVFVRLRRVGEHGAPFSLYKFRSMVDNAHAMKEELMRFNEREGPLFKMKNDPRITRFGRFIRRASIDELPQFWNVLTGTMSLVGPRPHEPQEVAKYHEYQRKLLALRPGITGLAQVSGRSDLHFDDEARLDLFYIENWSFGLDLTIIVRTPAVVLRMKSAA